MANRLAKTLAKAPESRFISGRCAALFLSQTFFLIYQPLCAEGKKKEEKTFNGVQFASVDGVQAALVYPGHSVVGLVQKHLTALCSCRGILEQSGPNDTDFKRFSDSCKRTFPCIFAH